MSEHIEEIQHRIFDFNDLSANGVRLSRFYNFPMPRRPHSIGMSQLGQSLLELGLAKILPPRSKLHPDKFQVSFIFGHILEDVVLDNLFPETAHRQLELEWEGIVGHIDGVFEDVLIDVKTTQTYKAFNPGNYYCQLAMYFNVFNLTYPTQELKGAGLIVYDKSTGLLYWDGVDNRILAEVFETCKTTIHLLKQITDPITYAGLVDLPQPIAEKKNREWTGRYLRNPATYRLTNELLSCFYNWYADPDGKIIVQEAYDRDTVANLLTVHIATL